MGKSIGIMSQMPDLDLKSRDILLVEHFRTHRGCSFAELGRQAHLSRERIRQIMKSYDVKTQRLGHRISKEEFENYYLKQRLPIKKICAILGITEPTVSRIRRYYQISVRDYKRIARCEKHCNFCNRPIFIRETELRQRKYNRGGFCSRECYYDAGSSGWKLRRAEIIDK
ncbi:MAG: helix-turn-helix domain-containing protein [Thermodesulfobacteriota bacterium]